MRGISSLLNRLLNFIPGQQGLDDYELGRGVSLNLGTGIERMNGLGDGTDTGGAGHIRNS